MTARIASPGGLPGRAVPVAVLLALAAAVGSYGIMSVAAAGASPMKAIAAVAGPAFLVVAVLRPDFAALMIPVMVFSNAGLVLNENFNVPNVLRATLLLLGALLLTRTAWRWRVLRTTPVLWAGGTFVLVRALSALQSPDADLPKTATTYAYGLLVLVLVTAITSRSRHLQLALFVIVATAAMIATATVLRRAGVGGTWGGFAGDVPITRELQAVMNRSGLTIDTESRVAGPVADPNFWAQCLVLALPMSLWALRERTSLASRVLAWGATLAILVGIVYTQSRGGLMAAVLAVGLWMWFQGGRIRKLLTVLPLIVAVVFVAGGGAQRFSALQDLTNPRAAADESIRGRLSENIAAINMWRDHPVLGVGADRYPPNYRQYALRIGLDSRLERNAHNSYLQMAAESGTLGVLAFVGMLLTGGITAVRTRRRLFAAGLATEAGVVEAVLAGGVGFCFAAIFLHQAWPDYLWLTLGLIGGAWMLAEHHRTTTTTEAA